MKFKIVKSASGESLRPVLKAKIKIANKDFTKLFTLADRESLNYRVLIGRNILVGNKFLIDPSKK